MDPIESSTLTESKSVAQPETRLFRAASVVAGMTLISRVLGFVRDVTLASVFGAGGAFDAFVVAFKLPNFMRRLFAEGAFSQAFVPVLSEYRARHRPEQVMEFINRVAGNLMLVLFLVVILAQIAAPGLIYIFAPGFTKDAARYQLATHMLRIIFPYLFLISLAAFSAAILNTWNRFGIPALAPVLLNIVLIAVAWFWAPHVNYSIYVLAWGVIIGGVAQFLIQLPFLKRIQVFPIPRLSWRDPGVRRVLKLMIPAIFGASVTQVSILIDNIFASFLQTGSISWLYYSDRLTYLPQSVIGVALATVVLPNLARQHSNGSHASYSATLDWSLRLALLIGLPAAVGLLILSGPILATLFHHGKFNSFDVIMTCKSVMAFAVGLPAFMLVKILASAFYSRQDIKTPVKIATVAVAINVIFNIILIKPLLHAGLALATSIAACLNASLLIIFLLKNKYYRPQSGWWHFIFRAVIANLIMAGLLFWLSGHLQQWLTARVLYNSGRLFILIIIGMLAYLVSLLAMGFRIKHVRPP